MSDHASYSVPSKAADSSENLSPAEKLAISESLRQPGRAVLDGNGYRVEGIQSTPQPPTVQERSRDWLNSLTGPAGESIDLFNTKLRDSQIMVPLPDGDSIPLSAAKAAGLIKRNARGEYVSTWESTNPNQPSQQDVLSAEKGKDQQGEQQSAKNDTTAAEDLVSPLSGDRTLGTIAEAIGDARVYSLIERTALGQGLSDLQARSIAQTTGNEPEAVAAMYDALTNEYSEVGTKALIAAGVPEDRIAEAIEWARQNRKGDLIDSFNEMVSQKVRSTSKLKQIGRDYMTKTGGSYSDVQLEEMALPDNARWHRGDNNELLVTIDNYGTLSAQAAMRQGILRF